jgi:hypothetical protein
MYYILNLLFHQRVLLVQGVETVTVQELNGGVAGCDIDSSSTVTYVTNTQCLGES